nr:uncharacterized protein B0416.5-like isoform X2 [Procambarus clarkii]
MEESNKVDGAGVENGGAVGARRRRASPPTYRLYKQRWAVLVTVTILNISNASLWINLAPVATKAAEYYKMDVEAINWFSLVYLYASIPFCFISTFSVNALGLRAAIHIGSAMNCLGGVIRAVSTSGLITPLHAQYAVGLTGQTIAGMAQSFLLFIPTKVSQLWFPEHARVVSTTILALSNPLGIMVAQISSPLIVQATSLAFLNYVFGGVALLAQLFTLVCITRSKPPTSPSQSAERGDKARAPYLQQLKETFTCGPYILLLLAMGCGVGIFNCLATVTQQFLCPLGYDDVFSGMSNGVMILSGFVGSAITGILADRTKAFAPITLIGYGFASISAIVMMELFMVPGQPVLVALFMGLFGFFGVGAYPIGLELSVETTFPVEESISTAFIFMSGQVQGVIIIAMVTLLARDPKSVYEDIEVCTHGPDSNILPKDYTVSLMAMMAMLAIIVSITITFLRTPYKRLEAEQASSSLNSSNSSSSHSLTATPSYTSENVNGVDTSTKRSMITETPWPDEEEKSEIVQSHL